MWKINIVAAVMKSTFKYNMDVTEKAVKFNLLPKIYHMRVWSFAYEQARKGQWEQFVRDRDRFKRRISRDEAEISIILSPIHREKIYRLRFQN